MSMGYEGRLILEAEDDKHIIYKYACGNVNKGLEVYRADIARLDGIITIDKNCFVAPEIHQKVKKTPSGKKKAVEKRIVKSVDYGKYIEDGLITVENAGACWREIEGIDFIALRLLFKLFNEYQEDGKYPEKVSIFW